MAITLINPAALYLAGAVVLSLAVNTFTSAYGTVPTPVNRAALGWCTLAAFVSAVAFSSLAWRVEAIKRLAEGQALHAGVTPQALISDVASAYWTDILARFFSGLIGVGLSILFLFVIP
ncbi:hypothetical protein ACGF3J_16340 [Streptomyces sp. NPDC048171]|uniref:hypothetical protein n=1 Tax=unclassified Streptomyces TaxID=2593676 RepID=UPI00136A45B0|nr:hypothetical protein [Streptomyces sp. SID5789]MZE75332.1 hypothetical protein [Streptomyces sp. SID5789]